MALVLVLVIGIALHGAKPAAPRAAPGPTDNGEAVKAPLQIYTDSKTAFARSSSVHLSGTVPSGASTLTIDISETRTGEGSGFIEINGITVNVKLIKGTTYMQGADFFAQLGAPSIGDQWVSMPATSAGASEFGSLFTFLEQPDNLLTPPSGALTKGADATVNNELALTLSDGTGTLYIAKTGPPYPLRISSATGSSGVIDLDEYGATVDLTPPTDLYVGSAPGTTTL